MTKKRYSFFGALVIFSLMGQIAWVLENMYFNVFIYKTFSASAADISAMVAASAVTATLTTVFIGALSDRIGKRKVFMVGGYILWGVSIFSFVFLKEELLEKAFGPTVNAAALGILLAITLDCVMTFFGSSANDAAFNAWLTDSTTRDNRGLAEGINAMMPLVAVLVVFGGFMFFDLEKSGSWTWIFSIIGVLTLLIGISGIFLIEEPRHLAPSKTPYLGGIVYGFRPSTARRNGTLYLAFLAFAVFNISIQIFMPYLIIYYEVSLGMTNYVFIMAPAIIIASLVTVLWGKFYDRKGFSVTGLSALGMLLTGYIILHLSKMTLPVFIGSLLMMSGYLSGMAVFGALIRDRTPEGKAGRLQGIRIFSQVLIPGVVGPFIGEAVLGDAEIRIGGDGTAQFVPNENIFLAAAVAAALVLPFFFLIKNGKKERLVSLETDFEKDLADGAVPFSEYPRPTMKRDSYLCLNGPWQFTVRQGDKVRFRGEIRVPFPVESRLSGVEMTVEKKDLLVYERRFSLPDGFRRDRVLLHVGASDQYTTLFVNGQAAGEHVGGYLPFSVDVTDLLLEGENTLCIEVRDPLDRDLPYGKQRKNRGGMWYTPVSGIWQTVWMESVPRDYIRRLEITSDLSGIELTVEGGVPSKTLLFQGKEYTFTGDCFRLTVENPVLWTPETPHLYEFTLLSGDDRVESYFGLRTVSVAERCGHSLIALNGQPIFCHGLLDQGYFSDGIFLPGSVRGYREDILKMKACGFNMLRKHIKLEPEIFYYECDRLGILLFQDMINSGPYSFLVDTALPTVGLKKGISHRATARRREAFFETAEGMIDLLRGHPSVVYYTIFNEGWGQFDASAAYARLKKRDPSRIYDTTSGWFKTDVTDVESDHVYFKPVRLKSVQGRPLVLSEFGGYSYKIKEHSFNLDKTYGYRFFQDQKTFEDALAALYEDEILEAIRTGGLSAAVLTQVSDVEDETNGLLTYDRKVLKVSEQRMRDVSRKLHRVFDEKFG